MWKSLLFIPLSICAVSCGDSAAGPDPDPPSTLRPDPPAHHVPVVVELDAPLIEVTLFVTKRNFEGYSIVDWGFRNQMDQTIIMVHLHFQCNSPSDGFTSWSAAVEEVTGYQYLIDPIEPGGMWVFRDWLEGAPSRNSSILFGPCENRKLELTIIRTDEEERPYKEGQIYHPNTHVRFVEQSG